MTLNKSPIFQRIIRGSRMRLRYYQLFLENLIKWIFISVIIGILIGTASAGFLYSLIYVTDYREDNLWIIAFLPLCGFAIGWGYYKYGKEVEAGNNILIDNIHSPGKLIPFRMAPMVYLGTIATHLFGGSAGREGTALQMAGAIADQFSKPFKLSNDERRILIVAAVAGGFGSVFGTPLAGAIFALEFFHIGRLRYNALLPAFMTAVIADHVTHLWKTPHTHYHIDLVPEMSLLNIALAIVTGISFGLCAMTFSKSGHWLGTQFKTRIKYPPFRPVLGGVIVAGLVWVLGTSKYIGLGIPTIVGSFEVQLPAYDFFIKLVLTVITLAAGFKGGEVTPLFFIGATLGNALGLFIPLPIGLLAGMGFVAVFAGATNTPIACSIMAIELFGADCGVYAALACVSAYLFSGHNSIYRHQLIGESKNPILSALEGKRINEI